jgi:serine O-acetyltransferase
MLTMSELFRALGSDFRCLGYPSSLGAPSRLMRFIVNPSMHAVTLVRASQRGSGRLFPLIRLLLVRRHAIDMGRGIEIGDALYLPHPFGIVIASGVTIGSAVRIYHHVTLGLKDGGVPTIGSGVTIYPGSVVVGGISVGDGAIIGANSFVCEDVSPGAVVRGSARRGRSDSGLER